MPEADRAGHRGLERRVVAVVFDAVEDTTEFVPTHDWQPPTPPRRPRPISRQCKEFGLSVYLRSTETTNTGASRTQAPRPRDVGESAAATHHDAAPRRPALLDGNFDSLAVNP